MFTKKIVISDVSDLLDVLGDSFFRREGFRLIRVIDADEAFTHIESDSPALAILDLSSLGEAGVECCRRIKNDPLLQVTPVIIVLGADQSGFADRCWQAGCDQILGRPISALQLLDDACNLLGISRRLARRFPVSFHLEFSLHELKKHVGTAVNLNLGGMFLSSEYIYPIDTRLSLEFTLPGYRMPLNCSARVAWVNHPEWIKKNNLPCGMGLEFLDMSGSSEAALRDFMANLITD